MTHDLFHSDFSYFPFISLKIFFLPLLFLYFILFSILNPTSLSTSHPFIAFPFFLSCLKVLAAAEISKKEDSCEIGESPRAKIHGRLWHATSNLFNSRLKRLWQQMCRFSKFQYSVTQHKDVLIPHRRSPDLQRFKTCSQSQAVFSNTKSTY